MNQITGLQNIHIDIFEISNPPDPVSLFGAAGGAGFRAFWSTPQQTFIAVEKLLEFDSIDFEGSKRPDELNEAAILLGGFSFASSGCPTHSQYDLSKIDPPQIKGAEKQDIKGAEKQDDLWSGFKSQTVVLPRFVASYTDRGMRLIQAVPSNDSASSKSSASSDGSSSSNSNNSAFPNKNAVPNDSAFPNGGAFSNTNAPKNQTAGISRDFQALLEKARSFKIQRPRKKLKPAGTPHKNLDAADISAAIAEIQSGHLKKVVLADCQKFSGKISAEYLLQQLSRKFPSCAVFAFDFGPNKTEITDGSQEKGRKLNADKNYGRIFLGATPELLAGITSGRLTAAALASSAPRQKDLSQGLSQELSKELAKDPSQELDSKRTADKKLLYSQKELKEHLYVVQHILTQLKSAGIKLDSVPAPEVLKLAGISHLHTPISGAAPNCHILEMANLLAPTPAVAGLPVEPALEFISETEGFDRGWYSGHIGWCNPGGDGEFYVALRSALLDEDSGIHLFAGAGIVENSQPEKELAEIELKLRTLKDLIL